MEKNVLKEKRAKIIELFMGLYERCQQLANFDFQLYLKEHISDLDNFSSEEEFRSFYAKEWEKEFRQRTGISRGD